MKEKRFIRAVVRLMDLDWILWLYQIIDWANDKREKKLKNFSKTY